MDSVVDRVVLVGIDGVVEEDGVDGLVDVFVVVISKLDSTRINEKQTIVSTSNTIWSQYYVCQSFVCRALCDHFTFHKFRKIQA